MEPTDMDLHEASAWWSAPAKELTLDRAELDAMRKALLFFDEELDARLKSCETYQEKRLHRLQSTIAELLLRLGA